MTSPSQQTGDAAASAAAAAEAAEAADRAAAILAAAGVEGAQAARDAAQANVRVQGDDGIAVIRDPRTGEEVLIRRDAIPPWLHDGPSDGMLAVPIVLFISMAFVIVGLPIARAFARRMDRKHVAPAAVAPSAELRQLQTSIDTMALEIERMSEHQRFLTRVLSERTDESLAAPRDGVPTAARATHR